MAISLGTTMAINAIMGTGAHMGIDTVTAIVTGSLFRATTTATHTGTAVSTTMAIVTNESSVASVTATRDSTRVTVSTNDVRRGAGSATSSRQELR